MALLLYQWFAIFWLSAFAAVAPSTFSTPHAHPFYVGVVEVNHNKENAVLEVSCKMFTEDVEAVLEQQYKTSLDLYQPAQKATIDDLLTRYVQVHLSLQADTKKQPLHYLGFEIESESLYCYFEVNNVAALKTLNLRNSLLHDLTDKQINIVHVMAGGVRKSHKLDYPNTEAKFDF